MRSNAGVVTSLPPDLAALATDPRLSLQDGRFREFTVDAHDRAITIAIDCGNLQVGYRRLTLSFEGASIVPDDLQRMAAAVGAEFRANHWDQGRTVTEVLEHTVGALPNGRFVLRLRLWPFYEFAVEFSGFSLIDIPLAARGPARAGRFTLLPRPK
jgi:hypothetical protein